MSFLGFFLFFLLYRFSKCEKKVVRDGLKIRENSGKGKWWLFQVLEPPGSSLSELDSGAQLNL
jgi:hypothetical protein